jgi:hypothetical protein
MKLEKLWRASQVIGNASKVNWITRNARENRKPFIYVDDFGREIKVGWKPAKKDRDRCGAKTRAGGTCKAPVVWGKKRCRMHGGLSTGPKTAKGRARSLAALREYRHARREQGVSKQAGSSAGSKI